MGSTELSNKGMPGMKKLICTDRLKMGLWKADIRGRPYEILIKIFDIKYHFALNYGG